MKATPRARQRLLQYFDQSDRAHPGDFTAAGVALAALDGLDTHTAFQELRLLARDGQLELVGAPIGAVHALTEVRITNAGRKVGESATDRQTRDRVLGHIAAHAAATPRSMEDSPEMLQITATETYRAIIALAASGLITHKRVGSGLGVVQMTPRGQTVAARRQGVPPVVPPQ